MSWTIEKSSLMPDHRYKGFHKSNYAEPSRAKTEVDGRARYQHGLVQHFKEPGIEAKSEAEGLAYGSNKRYTLEGQSKRLSFNEQLEKKQKEYKDLEDFMTAHKQQKASIEASKTEEKRKDLEMLQKYQPWGRPAGGAPRMADDGERDTRRKRLDWESQSQMDDDQSLPFGRPGGGAPRRTNSGKLQTSITSDPATRFQRPFKKDVDHVLRYKSPDKVQEYARSLGKQVLEQYPKERHSSPYQNDYHPYGKPGGGAPLQGGLVAATRRQFEGNEESEQARKQKTLRYARRLEQQRIEAIAKKAKEFDDLKQPSSYDPWEKSNPIRDSSGNVVRHRQTLKHKMVVDLNDPPDNTAVTPRARIPQTIGVHGEGSVLDPSVNTDEVFNPWGRPGAGAPIKNNSGQVVTATQNHFNNKKQARPNINDPPLYGDPTLRYSENASKRNTSDVTTERLGIKRQVDAKSYTYHSELEKQAELRHHQRQKNKAEEQRLALEHVTRETTLWGSNTNPDPIRRKIVDPAEVQAKKEKAASYHSELVVLANQRHEEKKQQRDQNLIEDQKHLETFSNQWGRPGCGAPRIDQQGRLDAAQRLTSLSNAATTYSRRS